MYDNRYYLRKKIEKKCHQCGQPSETLTCMKCKKRKAILAKNRKQNRIVTQLCVDCGSSKGDRKGLQCEKCADKANQRALSTLKNRQIENRCYQCNRTKDREGILCENCFMAASERRRNSYKELREHKMCFKCKKQTDGSLFCEICYADRQLFLKEHCSDCGRIKEEVSNDRCTSCKDRRMSNYYYYKELVYTHYGARCNCCGEKNLSMLSVDHVKNDGNKHRERMGSASIYRDIVNNDYPDDYQILCYNCNCGRDKNPSFKGLCPHKMAQSPNWKSLTKRGQRKRWELKEEVLLHYGGACVCCSEKNVIFLTLDHANNDGAQHRKELDGEKIYLWAKRNNYPSFLRPMCYSCNTGSYRNGWICPHSQNANEVLK